MNLTRRHGNQGSRADRSGACSRPSLIAACATESTVPTTAPAGGESLRVGYLPITDATPLLVADGQGLLRRTEKPTLLRSWAQVAEAFQSRQVDLVHLLMPMTIQMRFGQDVPPTRQMC